MRLRLGRSYNFTFAPQCCCVAVPVQAAAVRMPCMRKLGTGRVNTGRGTRCTAVVRLAAAVVPRQAGASARRQQATLLQGNCEDGVGAAGLLVHARGSCRQGQGDQGRRPMPGGSASHLQRWTLYS